MRDDLRVKDPAVGRSHAPATAARDDLAFRGPLNVISEHWKTIASIGLFALIISAIFSGPTFIKPRYRSTATVYPVNLNSYSIETRTDQLLQLLESNSTERLE